ncbi:MBL fold metallo-hydrolase [Meridianimarinicoccus sp. RP-17]|uniref:MBL fold metallo-hydrolase n=1 Tax=Meridianimarinicoccus zhengii TaxID=2056810 RepID=UPI000DAD38B4|nr:MBL fold metallo-hydrolase [Phycocomes zhengii]
MRLLALALAALVALPAAAQDRRPSHCISLVQDVPGVRMIHKASWSEPLPDYTVRIRFIGHAMFLLQTPEGLSAVTDYSGFIGSADFVPTVATMNRAHSTHWTPDPDPRIPHVLPGWDFEAGAADHYLELDDMVVRNVPTDIRSYTGDGGENGNSIFVFETAGLCIGHVGHLHHEPTPEQYAALGRLDVVMVPVDGGFTMDVAAIMRVVKRLRSSVVIPMHWFGDSTLEYFLTGMEGEFAVDRTGGSEIELSLRTLPDRPTVKLLRPSYLRADE